MPETTKHSRGAASEDPIFDAIARHKAAWRVFDRATDDRQEPAEADQDEVETASKNELEALAAVLSTSPTTIAGIRAGIEYVHVVCDRECVPECAMQFMPTLLRSPVLAA